jgi:hypothetical protein
MTAAILVVLAAALAGCATTQQEAARLQLDSSRIRASQVPTRVLTSGDAVQVTRVAVVPGATGTAFVVQVHNPGKRSVSDLPISVGVRLAHRLPRYLNLESPAEFSYFDAHLPAIAPGRTVTWVYSTGSRLPAHARPFALVGGVPSVTARASAHPPVIVATSAATTASSQLAVTLHNLTTIPQYQLQVYAYAQDGDRFVVAGNLTVPHLGSQARKTVKLALLGRPVNARLQVEALATTVH